MNLNASFRLIRCCSRAFGNSLVFAQSSVTDAVLTISLVKTTSSRTMSSASHFPSQHSKRAIIIDGKAIARQIEIEVAAEISHLISSGSRRPPHLTAIIVGEDPASFTYVSHKIKACERSGITSDTIRLPELTTEDLLLRKIALLNADPKVDGILVQLPVPPHMDERRVCNVSWFVFHTRGRTDRLPRRHRQKHTG